METLNKTKKTAVFIVAAGLTILRLGLFCRMPYEAIGASVYDDLYLLRMAANLLQHSWLGSYDLTTLIKGISFPAFVAFAFAVNIPYSLFLGLFYVVSCAVFVKAVSFTSKNPFVLLGAYLIPLWSPVGFDAEVTQRLYRNAILFPAVLLVLSGILICFFLRTGKKRSLVLWLLELGFAFSFFYYIREDSVWFLPLLIGALLFTAIQIWANTSFSSKEKRMRSALLTLPLIILLGVSLGYKGINYLHYGVFLTSDRTQGAFAELTGNMFRVEDESGVSQDYWISRDTMLRIVDACPTLSEEKEIFLERYDTWADESGNVKGDWSVWAFRQALSGLHYNGKATEFDAVCRKINEELLQAVQQGTLRFDHAIHLTSQSRGVTWSEIPGFLSQTLKNIWNMARFKGANCSMNKSSGEWETIRFMQSITGVNIIYPDLAQENGEMQQDAMVKYSQRSVKIGNAGIKAGQILGTILFPLSLLSYVCLWVQFLKRKSWEASEPVIILTGILLSVFLLEFGVTVFNSWLGNIWFYSSGAIPLLQAFEIWSLVSFGKVLASNKPSRQA